MGAAGATNTSGITFGGYTTALVAVTEAFDGSSWTEVADLNTAKGDWLFGVGIKNAALCAGGNTPASSQVTDTESWNGTSWTEIGNINTARKQGGASGTQASAVIWGGKTPGNTANTEQFDGVSWTEVNNLPAALAGLGSGSTSSIAAFSAGSGPPATADSDEWTMPQNVEIITD